MAAAEPVSGPTYADIDRSVRRILEPPGRVYWAWVAFCFTLVAIAVGCWANQIYSGLGVTGLKNPTMWAIYITNFVFWIELAHSGTLISALLYLFRTRWRTAVYRAAEAMTGFAVATAALFPLIHLGRPWNFYWLLPYPNERSLQPDFRSPLAWDTFAVSTYLTISILFLIMGLIPDVANARDAAKGWRKTFYSLASLGWSGTDEQWQHWSMAYLLMAGLATPLIISVMSVVSWDFAMNQVPGWHETIFGPYFAAGAIFSGAAMVLTLLIVLRKTMNLNDLLTEWHFDNLAKLLLLSSLALTYCYICEVFITWYTKDPFDVTTTYMRFFGPQAGLWWFCIVVNCVLPLALFWRRIRRSIPVLFVLSILVNISMWYERYVLITGSLATSFNPSQWGFYTPSFTEIMITIGSFAWFFGLFSLFARYMPVISMTELKEGIRWLREALRDNYYPGLK